MVSCSVGHAPPIQMMVDSGSDWNLVSISDWAALSEAFESGNAVLYDITQRPNDCARAYGSSEPLITLWSFYAWIQSCDRSKPRNFAKCFVVENGEKSILGRETARRMKMLKLGAEVLAIKHNPTEGSKKADEQEFPAIPKFELEFDIDETVDPSVKAYVNIPEAYKEKAVERLREMERKGIIEKVTEGPRWISGLSAVPKGKDDFRLVVNMYAGDSIKCQL